MGLRSREANHKRQNRIASLEYRASEIHARFTVLDSGVVYQEFAFVAAFTLSSFHGIGVPRYSVDFAPLAVAGSR